MSGEEDLTLQLKNHLVIPHKDYKGPESLLLGLSLVLSQFNYVFLITCAVVIMGLRPPTPLCVEARHRKAEEMILTPSSTSPASSWEKLYPAPSVRLATWGTFHLSTNTSIHMEEDKEVRQGLHPPIHIPHPMECMYT